jgi:cytochrome c-type biogenesis protein CcmF
LYCEVEYFDLQPKQYNEGDLVMMQDMVFRANENHIASESFLKDWSEDSLWSAMMVPSEATEAKAKPWQPGKPGEYLFTLTPSVITSKKGNSREPSIKHFAGHDIYTFIKYTEMEPAKADTSGFLEPTKGIIKVGTPVKLNEMLTLTLDSLVKIDTIPENLPQNVVVKRGYCSLTDGQKRENFILASVLMNDSIPLPFPTETKTFRTLLSIQETNGEVELTAQEHTSTKRDMLIMTAEIFPQINILWIGCIVMVIGTTMAIRHRRKVANKELAE